MWVVYKPVDVEIDDIIQGLQSGNEWMSDHRITLHFKYKILVFSSSKFIWYSLFWFKGNVIVFESTAKFRFSTSYDLKTARLVWHCPCWSSFQMAVESNYAIAIAKFSDWLENLAPLFQPMRSKTKPIAPCTNEFSRALSKLQVTAGNSDWFTALFASVVTGRGDSFEIGFSATNWKPLYQNLVLLPSSVLKMQPKQLPVYFQPCQHTKNINHTH